MPFLVLHLVFSFLLDLAHVLARSDQEQALELLLLRQQLRLYERQAGSPGPRAARRSCSPHWPPGCPTSRGWPSSSPRPPCCAGIARSSGVCGRSTTARDQGGRRSPRHASSSSCAWHARIPAGATASSKASWARSATRSPSPRSSASSAGMGCRPHRSAAAAVLAGWLVRVSSPVAHATRRCVWCNPPSTGTACTLPPTCGGDKAPCAWSGTPNCAENPSARIESARVLRTLCPPRR
jgi:hypothetical protein